MNLEQRIARLERQNRRLRWVLLGAMSVLLVAVAMGATSEAPRDITASGISIVDDKGSVRLHLGAGDNEDSAFFRAFDAEGKVLVTLDQHRDAGRVTIHSTENSGMGNGPPASIVLSVSGRTPLITFTYESLAIGGIGPLPETKAGLRWQHCMSERLVEGKWTVEDVKAQGRYRGRR